MKGAKGGLGGVVLPAGHDEIPDLLERGTEFHHLGRRIFDGIQGASSRTPAPQTGGGEELVLFDEGLEVIGR